MVRITRVVCVPHNTSDVNVMNNHSPSKLPSLILGILFIILNGCSFFGSSDHPPLETVPSVDVQRYLGLWYEIASLPVRQQKGCSCTTAEYALLEKGVLSVINTCKKGDGTDRVEGKAFIVEGSNNAKLKVQFFWPFRGDYWVIDLAEDYSYAVVGLPSRKYCWILSRTPSMDAVVLDTLISRLRQKGFPTDQMQRTTHDCG